jgi:hypothetical protein
MTVFDLIDALQNFAPSTKVSIAGCTGVRLDVREGDLPGFPALVSLTGTDQLPQKRDEHAVYLGVG